MQEFFDAVVAADEFTWSMCMLLAFCGAGVVAVLLREWTKGVIYFPALLFGGLLGNYAFALMDWSMVPEKALNTVSVSATGMIGGLIGMLLLTKILSVVGGATAPSSKPVVRARRVF